MDGMNTTHSTRLRGQLLLEGLPGGEVVVSCPECEQDRNLLFQWPVGNEDAHTIICSAEHTWNDPRIPATLLRRMMHMSPYDPVRLPPRRTQVHNPIRDPSSRWPRWTVLRCPECGSANRLTAEYTPAHQDVSESLVLECMCMHRWPCPLGQTKQVRMALLDASPQVRLPTWWLAGPVVLTATGTGLWASGGSILLLLLGLAWALGASVVWALWARRHPGIGSLLLGSVDMFLVALTLTSVGAGLVLGGYMWGLALCAVGVGWVLLKRGRRRSPDSA